MNKNLSKVLSVMCSVTALSGVFGINSASAMDGKESNPSFRRSTKNSSKGYKRAQTGEFTSDESDDDEPLEGMGRAERERESRSGRVQTVEGEAAAERLAACFCCDAAAAPERRELGSSRVQAVEGEAAAGRLAACDAAAVPKRRESWVERGKREEREAIARKAENLRRMRELKQKIDVVNNILAFIRIDISGVTPATSIVDSQGDIDIYKFILVCMFKLENLYQKCFGESLLKINFVNKTARRMLERKDMNGDGLCMLVSFMDFLIHELEVRVPISGNPEYGHYLWNICEKVGRFGLTIRNMAEILDILSAGNVDESCMRNCTSMIVLIIKKMNPEVDFSIDDYDFNCLNEMANYLRQSKKV